MVKCPFCSFDNEDGALFCEQCKSDLGGAEVASASPVIATAQSVGEETVPLAPVAAVAANRVTESRQRRVHAALTGGRPNRQAMHTSTTAETD